MHCTIYLLPYQVNNAALDERPALRPLVQQVTAAADHAAERVPRAISLSLRQVQRLAEMALETDLSSAATAGKLQDHSRQGLRPVAPAHDRSPSSWARRHRGQGKHLTMLAIAEVLRKKDNRSRPGLRPAPAR